MEQQIKSSKKNNKSVQEDKSHNSSLNRPYVWLILFLFFAALPLFIIYMAYGLYIERNFEVARQDTLSFYNRELTSFANRSANNNILSRMFQNLRDNLRRNITEPNKQQRLIQALLEDLPDETTIILWDRNGNIVDSLTSTPKDDHVSVLPAFVRLLLDAHSDFTAGSDLQSIHQIIQFQTRNTAELDSFIPFFGGRFPVTESFTEPNRLLNDAGSSAGKTYFYWDYLNSADNSNGGFATIIPAASIPGNFGLDLLLRDQPTNPEFAQGYFDYSSYKVELTPANFKAQAKEIIDLYRQGNDNPFFTDDWGIFVLPLPRSSSINVFTIFNIGVLKQSYQYDLYIARFLSIIALLLLMVLFFFGYRVNKTSGISLQKKLIGLFFLCMQLPISLLIFLGAGFAVGQEKLLSSEAENRLIALVKKTDSAALEHYRITNEMLKSLKDNPAIKQADTQQMRLNFFEMTQSKVLSGLFLINTNAEVEADVVAFTGHSALVSFARELGQKTLIHHKTHRAHRVSDNETLSEGLFDILVRKTKDMNQIIWPGTGKQKFVFTDVIEVSADESLAMVAIIDKTELDRDYLRQAITNQFRNCPDHEIIMINQSDITDTIPRLPPTLRANILPMLSTVNISNKIETDKVSDGQSMLLVALGKGNIIDGFLIGGRASWGKITYSIQRIYILILSALILSAMASFFLVKVLLNDFLTPVSILSSGAKSIIRGELELVLPIVSKDELGELSATFNFMCKRLRNRITELTVLYNLTQKASTSHNQREVFGMAAQSLQDQLHAEKCGTAWRNEAEGDDSIFLTDHFEESEAEAIKQVSRQALRSYQTVHEFNKTIQKHIISIPLFFEDQKFGAIYLVFPEQRFSGEQKFSDDEKSFVETLRHHISLIIEKQRLFEQAITDGLTKLFLRRFFLATLEKEISRAKRYQLDVSVILMDIDHFKIFNDTHGHQAGDFVLKETAQRILESIRSVDTPCRYGGEEMAVILPQTGVKDAFVVAERIRKAIADAHYTYKNTEMSVTTSFGLTSLNSRDKSVEEMIDEADKALYVAKRKGRNQVRIAPEAM